MGHHSSHLESLKKFSQFLHVVFVPLDNHKEFPAGILLHQYLRSFSAIQDAAPCQKLLRSPYNKRQRHLLGFCLVLCKFYSGMIAYSWPLISL